MSLTSNMNFLSPTNFKLTIDIENYKNLSYFVQSFNHPSVSIPAVPVQYKRAKLNMAGDKLEFADLQINILLDEDMEAYTELYQWAERLVNEEQKDTNDRIRFGAIPTFADITLNILSSKNNVNKQIRYKDCVLTNIGDVTFEVNAGGDTFLTLPATFSFSTFELL